MSAYFSNEEFEQIKRELEEQGESELLYAVTRRLLMGKIRKHCAGTRGLDPEQSAEDVMQEVQYKVWRYSVVYYFKDPKYAPHTAESFKNWLFKVEYRAFLDYLKQNKRHFADEIPETYSEDEEPDNVVAVERINEAFRTVLSSRNSIHIVLSWLAQNLLIAQYGIDRCQTSDMVDKNFRSMSLDTMLNVLVLASNDISWLNLDEDLIEEQRKKLNRTYKDGRRWGDLRFGEFYDDKSAISKWGYRMNQPFRTEEEKKDGTSEN